MKLLCDEKKVIINIKYAYKNILSTCITKYCTVYSHKTLLPSLDSIFRNPALRKSPKICEKTCNPDEESTIGHHKNVKKSRNQSANVVHLIS